MSSENGNYWGALCAFCLTENLRFVPGPEPWFSYEAIGRFCGQEEATIKKKCQPLRKHPLFPGFVRCTDLEWIEGEETQQAVAHG